MFAVIRTGGKQYTVTPGCVIDIEKLEGEKGQEIIFEDVLLCSSDKGLTVGTPIVEGAKVCADIVTQMQGPKVRIFKKIRRQGKQLRKGHRQQITKVKIKSITA
jgi:large subunit ribosomal protein L21